MKIIGKHYQCRWFFRFVLFLLISFFNNSITILSKLTVVDLEQYGRLSHLLRYIENSISQHCTDPQTFVEETKNVSLLDRVYSKGRELYVTNLIRTCI